MINCVINYKCFCLFDCFLSLNKGKKTEGQRSYLNKKLNLAQQAVNINRFLIYLG